MINNIKRMIQTRNNNTVYRLSIIMFCLSMSIVKINGQIISNISVIHSENPDKVFTANAIDLEETEAYNYLGLEFGNRPMYMNGELIAEGGHPFTDELDNFYYLIQMDKENNFKGYTNIYIKGEDEDWSSNVADFNQNVGVTTKDNLVYLYGSLRFTDSLFVKDEYIKSIPRGGAFVLTFNEQLELIDDFFYGLDTLARQHDVALMVDQHGNYHLSGRFHSPDTTFSLPFADQSLDIINNLGDGNSTYYYGKINHNSKLVEFVNVFGGGVTNWLHTHIAGFVLDGNENACILFNQFGNLEFNGVLIPDEPYPNDVTQLCMNTDSLRYHIHYEGPTYQDANVFFSFESGSNYEFLTSAGGGYPLFIEPDTFYFNAITNELIIKRDSSGQMQWLQNISSGPQAGINIEDMNYSESTESLWMSGQLRKDSTFYIDSIPLVQENLGEGFLMELDDNTGAFKRIFWPTIESDFDVEPKTNIIQLGQENDGRFKVISRLGFKNNVAQETYDYTIGDLTIPVSGKGELVIFDFEPDGVTSTVEQAKAQNFLFPNPVSPGQIFHFNDEYNKSYSLYNIGGIKIAEIKNNEIFPALNDGIYFLRGNSNGAPSKICVLNRN